MRQKKTITRKDVRFAATRLRRMAGEYEKLAEAMEKEPFDGELQVEGTVNRDKGLDDLGSWLGNVQGAYAKAVPPEENGDADAPKQRKPPKK